MIGVPFSAEAAAYARRFAGVDNRHADSEEALTTLLARWSTGQVVGRRERRIAARLAADRTSLPELTYPLPIDSQDVPDDDGTGQAPGLSIAPDLILGDDDDDDELLADVAPADTAMPRWTFELIS